ncbi:MAG: alpha/beta hydrolase [Candidatus Omnitrophota bacterium]|nr:MAG: alpha/beta hydrolase [Candidatus Omnitrophota bacterium]
MIIKLFVYALIFFGLTLIYVKYIERRGIYYPMREVGLDPSSLNLSFEDVFLETQDHIKIHGWFIPAQEAYHTVLFCHGNAGNIGHRIDKIAIFNQLGVDLFMIDYRGYGKSKGNPSEAGLYLDAQAAYRYLTETRRIEPHRIILYGESLGSAVAIHLASQQKIGGLVTEGTFSCGKDMAKIFYPYLPSFFFSNTFDSLSKIGKVDVPKLLIHSLDDEILPFALAKKLFAEAKEPKHFVQIRGSHNIAFLDDKEKYVSALEEFIKNLQGIR